MCVFVTFDTETVERIPMNFSRQIDELHLYKNNLT